MAETCFVCNKKIGLFDSILTTCLSWGTTGIHYGCRSKYNDNPEKYGGPSTEESESNITQAYATEEPIGFNQHSEVPDTAAISTLNAVANGILYISFMCGLVLAIQVFYAGSIWTGLIGLGIFVCGLIQWAVIRVFSGIAEDIRGIRMEISRSVLKSMSQSEND